eukprot:565660-Pyramimonas_sp.AAC.1
MVARPRARTVVATTTSSSSGSSGGWRSRHSAECLTWASLGSTRVWSRPTPSGCPSMRGSCCSTRKHASGPSRCMTPSS